jgi:DNA-binding NtrC family response regulator
MRVLVVEANQAIGTIWCDHLERQGAETVLAPNEETAINALRFQSFDVLVINLLTPNCSVLSISDFATYRSPEIAIIVVTSNSFFSDGSIFDIIPNTRGFLNSPVQPTDLAAMVEHYGMTAERFAKSGRDDVVRSSRSQD